MTSLAQVEDLRVLMLEVDKFDAALETLRQVRTSTGGRLIEILLLHIELMGSSGLFTLPGPTLSTTAPSP